jgi:hypothetical protein
LRKREENFNINKTRGTFWVGGRLKENERLSVAGFNHIDLHLLEGLKPPNSDAP